MSLNIKDPEAHKLAQVLAEETGETMTAAVTRALKERLDRIRQEHRQEAIAAELDAIAKRGAALDRGPYIDHADLLYDEKGLPK
jgi:antitoxin VapB